MSQRVRQSRALFAAQFTAIGALSDVVLKYYNWEKKEYEENQIHEQVEVASLLGDVAKGPTGEPAIHAHIVVGKRDGFAMAGHPGEAHVRPTLEVIFTESPAHLRKFEDPETGLAMTSAASTRPETAGRRHQAPPVQRKTVGHGG